ncbi:hypothetical protein M404DRAFT_1001659 [Pisolithus tinctorius Marx 270]|uniref:Uncharacterized protein n=1 Tax=Pisolithus tinctorius Marx 270 TaxID=870435 RepID=A0A0C3P661_PISTI|nr:hypothetical protein M404DRAFT_1001659 [Pisolithus tinctorius Marx 270]
MTLWPWRAGLQPRKTTEVTQQAAGLYRQAAESPRHFAFKTDDYWGRATVVGVLNSGCVAMQ